MAIPNYEAILEPMLETAADGAHHCLADLRDALAQRLELDAGELAATYPSGMRIFDDVVDYAKRCLISAGLLAGPSAGEVRITAKGRELLGLALPAIDYDVLKACLSGRTKRRYPKLVRIVTIDEKLKVLEEAFRRSP